MRWTQPMAEAIVKLRAIYLSGDFDHYGEFHIQQDHRRLCPTAWTVAPKWPHPIEFVMSKLGLTLHPDKTRMVDLRRWKGSFVFLGCTIRKKRSILRAPWCHFNLNYAPV